MQVLNRMTDTRQLQLTKALMIYQGDAQSDAVLVTISNILNSPQGPVIGPGELLDRSALADVLRTVEGAKHRREILHERVLYQDASRMMWYAPSCVRPIWYSDKYNSLNKTVGRLISDINGRDVLHPALLFLAEPRKLSIWALASDARPTATTRLYVAPYLNLYDNGSMCAGNVALPLMLSTADIDVWEKSFYETKFTHSNYKGVKICCHPKGHDALWRSLVYRQSWRGFPSRYLTPACLNKETIPLTAEGVLNK